MKDRALQINRAHGFTLVEVLVAMTLLSLVLVTLYSGLYSAGQSWQAGERQIKANENQRLELAFLQKKISSAIPLTLYDAQYNKVLFEGEEDSISFVSTLPSHRGGEWVYLITLRPVEQDSGKVLELAYEPIRTIMDLPDDESTDATVLTLIENLGIIEFRYFGSERINLEPDWYSTWEVHDRLPDLVEIRIKMAGANEYLPDMLVPLRTQTMRGQPQQILYATDADRSAG